MWGQESRCGRCFGVFALLPILFTMSFPPPRGNPGWLYAWYCVALLPRRCPSPPPPPRVPHQVRDDGAMRRCTIAPLCTAAFFLFCHSGLRAGILGGLMRGIALHYCLAGVHPRQHLPGSRIKCGMTAYCAVVPLRLSVRPPFFLLCHSGLDPESWVALCVVLRCVVVIPPQHLPGSRIKCGMTAYCAAVPSRSLCTAARTPTMSCRT